MGVSRRGFLGGLFRKSAQGIEEKLQPAIQGAEILRRGVAAKAAPAGPAPRAVEHPRRLRPERDAVAAAPDASGRFVADFRAKPFAPGDSYRVTASELAEPLVVVRVDVTHYAAATGECPVDGSDVLWQGAREVLWCPGCGSQWRLDGTVVRGPARRRLLSLHVDEAEGRVRIDVP